MDSLVIGGGVPLRGTVRVGGAKNAALPCMAAALLADGPVALENVPRLADVRTIARLLQHLGVEVEGLQTDRLTLRAGRAGDLTAPYDLVRTMRASVLVLGPLVARYGRARVSLPGGCAIGPRPINLHLAGLEKLGAAITLSDGYVEAKASRLRGERIVFDMQTVTGTENLMMAAALAAGITVLENAACEPEVADLADLLNAMGARVRGAGTTTITVEGVAALRGAAHRIIPDRIETGTLLVAGAITGGDVTVTNAVPRHLGALLAKLEEAGAVLDVGDDRIRCRGPERPRPTDVITSPFPGFPTDMQAQLMTLLGLAEGLSRITETIFENRFMHAAELNRMGARIEIDGATALIQGVPHYQGAPVMATDLRASASLVLAGLAARGRTEVSRVYHLDRGYERLEAKLQALGGRVRRLA